MDKNKHIDDVFREKLADYKPDYNPEHWEIMKAVLDNSRNIRSASGSNITNILLIISGVIIVTTAIFTYVLSEKIRKDNILKTTPALVTQNQAIENQQNVNEPLFSNNITSQAQDKSTIVNHEFYSESSSVTTNSSQNTVHNKNLSKNTNNNDISSTNVPTDKNANEIKNKTTQASEKNTNILPTYEVFNSTEEITNNPDRFTQEEIYAPLVSDEEDVNTIITDYNEKLQKSEKKKKQQISKANFVSASKKANLLPPPDYKIGVMNNFLLNPAYSGFNQQHTINVLTMVYKPLFKPGDNFNVPFEYTFAYDFNFGKLKNCGMGISYNRFIGAAQGLTSVDVSFAYRFIPAQYHSLRIGASLSFNSFNINRQDLSFPDMIGGRYGFVYNTSESISEKTEKNRFDLGIGAWYNWRELFVGLSAKHLTAPEVGVINSYRIPRQYILSGGYAFTFYEKHGFMPAFNLIYNEKTFSFTPAMLFTINKWLLVGTEFQNIKDAGLIVGFNIKDNVIIHLQAGVPMNTKILKNFGVIDYSGVNVRLQFGKNK